MDVVCDTSFLMVLVSKPIKQIDRVEVQLGRLNFLVPDLVVKELANLEQKLGPKRSMVARTASQISISKFNIVKFTHSDHVDDTIVEYARAHKCAVATLDRNLRRRLIKNSILVITLSKDHLVLANYVNDRLNT
jgi:rRNA-processing protein FCF1